MDLTKFGSTTAVTTLIIATTSSSSTSVKDVVRPCLAAAALVGDIIATAQLLIGTGRPYLVGPVSQRVAERCSPRIHRHLTTFNVGAVPVRGAIVAQQRLKR